jgi:bifunctional DNA-binding transcriptional regulator/antitoxin component of YhaV-PrlF toxin-antitoxin module
MSAVKGRSSDSGRLIVPAAFRERMGLKTGDTAFMELMGDEQRVRPARSELRRLQAKLRPLAPAESPVSDEPVAERRAEAERG